jgi:phage FluMu gp28-like protein
MESTENASPHHPKDVLLPYQIRWLADETPIKIAEKSRRVGLTWTEAAASALAASTNKGMDTWYLGYNQDMAREFVETAAAWARQFDKAAKAIEEIAIEDERRDLLAYRVRFASGHKIVALSSRPSNLRGKQGRAVIDEAAFHDDLKGLLKAALAFTMWGGCVRVMSTHNGANSYFNELVNEIRAGRKPYAIHRVTFDDAIADGLYQRICRKLGRKWSSAGEAAWRAQIFAEYGEEAEEELLCIPRSSGGAYLSSVLIEGRMRAGVPVIRWELAEEFARRPESERSRAARDFCEEQIGPHLQALDGATMSFLGEDFGRSGDLTVIWPLQLKGNTVRRTPFVIELRNIPFRQQEQVLFYVADRLPNFVAGAMDARGNGQYLAETAMQRYGGRIQQVMLSNQWYRDHMPRYKAAFEDGMIELPLDAEILADHRALVMEDGVVRIPDRRNSAGESGKRRHGDAAIAGALAYFASQAQVGEISYQAAPGKRLFETSAGLEMPPRAEADGSIRAARRSRFGLAAGTW